MKKLSTIIAAALIATCFISGCVKGKFDSPPDNTHYDPNLPVTMTIAAFKNLNGIYNNTTGGDTTLITDDITISGVVVADDRSGNFYKQIVIDDGTGGLFVDVDQYSLFSNFPVGRKIYIKCKGLYLGYNGGTAELGGSITERLALNGITGAQINDHIVKGPVDNALPDTAVTLDAVKAITAATVTGFNRNLVGRLITINDVQFSDPNATYADPNVTTNRTITDCVGSKTTLVVRTSNYANFQAVPVPQGKGSITGIFTLYQSSSYTPQLVIRDTSDVKMDGARCGVIVTSAPVTIDSLRKMYTSGTVTLSSVRVAGTVISDLSKGNSSTGNFILEDASKKGIILYVSGGTYNLGDSLVIDATGAKLQLYSGALELSGATSSKITKAATGKAVAPIQLTLQQLKASFSQYESVLVKIVNATISGSGGTYSGNKILTDPTGTISLYTASGASFASSPVPTGTKTVVGIATVYPPDNEIKLRDPAIDVY